MFFPLFRRTIIDRLYGIKSGSSKLRHWRELEKTQYLPEDILREKQWLQLTRFLQYVYANNRFYKRGFDELGLKPWDIKTRDDMKRIPILTKRKIRENIDLMFSNGYRKEDLLEFRTGGSTGKPLEIYITEECSELRNACARRHDRWTGWEVGEPVGAVWGNPKIPSDLKSKLRNWLLSPTIYLDTMQVNEESVIEFGKEWERIKPTLLFGHAHSIFVLAEYVQNLRITSIRPKGIICSSMKLMFHERKKIEEVFNVKVFDRYGCEEVSLIGCECEKHEGMHLNVEHLFIEFVNEEGELCKPGETGNLIVTDFVNRAMPFIRYQIGDVGVPVDRKCACGRGLPMMESLMGRVADFLIKSDGTKIAGVSLIENTLTKIPGIEQMQIIQEALGIFSIRLVPGPGFIQEKRNALTNYFENLFGTGTTIHLEIVNEIKPERSGKYRFSICNVKT